MKARTPERTTGQERARAAERTDEGERAISPERTVADERAVATERTIVDERADAAERTVPEERAVLPERTTDQERARSLERTDEGERATTIEQKADRLVRAGAVRIVSRVLDPRAGPLPRVVAVVDGDTGSYRTELGATGTNSCTCPASAIGRRRCSHIRAFIVYEKVGGLWAAQERALQRTKDRREADGPPLGDTKGRESRWPQDRKGRP